MPAAKPPRKQKTAPPDERVEVTDPGGPSPDVLAQARKEDAPVQPGPGDATLVYDKNKGRPKAADAPRLVVTAGPRKGHEFPLMELITTIGRGEGNVFVVPDISVSRQHSRVEKQGERYVVFDQGSGNGTRVNGKSIERYPLQHGDEIEMGDTKIQFMEPGGIVVKGGKAAPARLADEPEVTANKAPLAKQSALKKRAPLYGAIVVALAIVFAAGLVKKRRQDQADAEAAAQGAENREFAQKRFQEGVSLLKAGKWVEARDKLKIAAELDGQDPEIARYLESAENEAPRAAQLQTAKAALARRDYSGARTALSGIPEDSALSGSAHELAQQIKDAIDAAVRDAKSRVESGDAQAAQELIEPVLAAEPSRADALAVREAIAGQKRASAPVERKRVEKAEPVAAQPAPDVQSVLEAYLAGDIGGAIERAQASSSPRGERMLQDLKSFDASYKDGLSKKQAGRAADAVRALEQAASADRAISGGKDGRLGHEVRKALSLLHTQLGQASIGNDDTLPTAAAHFRSAVQDDPSNDQAASALRQIGDRCKDIYLRGYVAKDDDAETARKAFKLVVSTLPSSDETAQKAKRWLDKLDGKVTDQ